MVLSACGVLPVHAQENGKGAEGKAAFVPHYYHLDFVVKELEGGKVINSREYGMSIATAENPAMDAFNQRSIRTGTKVPVQSEPGKVNYLDVGVSIDCKKVVETAGKLAMEVSAEVSSVADPEGSSAARGLPMIVQNRWNSQVMVALGRPTVLFSSDEVTSKRVVELELTATELK